MATAPNLETPTFRLPFDNPTQTRMPITEHHRRKRRLNLTVAALLLGFALLLFAITLVKFGGGS